MKGLMYIPRGIHSTTEVHVLRLQTHMFPPAYILSESAEHGRSYSYLHTLSSERRLPLGNAAGGGDEEGEDDRHACKRSDQRHRRDGEGDDVDPDRVDDKEDKASNPPPSPAERLLALAHDGGLLHEQKSRRRRRAPNQHQHDADHPKVARGRFLYRCGAGIDWQAAAEQRNVRHFR